MLKLKESLDVNNTLGEGLVWDASYGAVWWTDIEQYKLYCYQVNAQKLTIYPTPYRLCAFGFSSQAQSMIAAFDCGIAQYNYTTQKVNWLFQLPTETNLRFNDGRVDAKGRFWVGTMDQANPQSLSGGLYCVSNDLTVLQMDDRIGIANGIAWSNDSSIMYLADSARQLIFKYDFDLAAGQISNKMIYTSTSLDAFPDGAIVDSHDQLWSAHWGGSCLVRYGNDSAQDTIPMPVSQPTCVTFGGENNHLLFVTTATYGLTEQQQKAQPLAGSLLIYESDIHGIDSSSFEIY
jgi:L-arabinonolactonase